MKIKKLILLSLLLCLVCFVDAQTITGIVTDAENDEPLPFASVIVPNTTIGTQTDFDGRYTLELPIGATQLQAGYVGYTSLILEIEGQSVLNFSLEEGEALDEIIVIGYGTQKKSDKTGAVTFVTAEELNKGRLSDPIQSLQGKAAGVLVSKKGGDPNAGFSVVIRGAAGLTSGSGPLYVVDGVPGVDPTTLNPDDIESFNVLKDASSTAIYGSRGANGVIIITTKGSQLRDKDYESSDLEYNAFISLDNVANKLDFLSSSQIRDFAESTGSTFIDNGADVDWQDEIYRTGITNAHTIAFSGSDNNSAYRASLSANQIEGVLKGSDKNRYIGRLNLSQKALNDRLTLSGRLSATIEHNDYVNYGGGINPNNVIYQAYRRNPTDPVLDENGEFFETDKSFQYFNPVAIIDQFQNERDAKRLLGNFRADLDIIPGLIGSINLAYLRDDSESFYFEPSFAAANATEGLGRRSYENREQQLIESTLNYSRTLQEVHSINLIGGHSYQIDNFDGFSAEGKEAKSDYVTSHNLEALLTLDPGSISSYKNQALLASFFGRAVYDFDKKYFLTATLRRDGSSKFGKNNEWGWFPSASVGWNLMRESFLQDIGVLSQLKLRAGYGITGNQDVPIGIDAVLFGPSGTAIDPESGEVVIAFNNSGDINPNPDLKWEENAEANIGLDFGIYDNRISGSLEFYDKNTTDLIYRYELPVPPNRNRYIYANAGEIKNRGLEATIQAFIFNKKAFDWKTIVTFATNNQETVSLSNDLYDLDEIKGLFVSGRGLVGGENWTQLIAPGFEIGTFYMPEYAGLSEDGKFLFWTEAGGVTRFPEFAERRVVGSAQPDFTLGWSNYFELGKGFDASFALRSVVGFQVMNMTRMVFSNPSDLPTLNVLESALEEYDRGLTSSPTVSSYYLEDGTFLKLDNASLGYTVSNLRNTFIKGLRIYLTGSNLLTLTNYTGIDPELSYGGIEFGLDQYDVYPKTRSFTLGLNAKF